MRIEKYLKLSHSRCPDYHTFCFKRGLLGDFVFKTHDNYYLCKAVLFIMTSKENPLNNYSLYYNDQLTRHY